MRERKYIVHVGVLGAITILVFFATSCNPLGTTEITQIVNRRLNTACEIKAIVIEPDPIPQTFSPIPTRDTSYSGTANASLTGNALVSPSAEPTEWES